jgi:hypothetical protein
MAMPALALVVHSVVGLPGLLLQLVRQEAHHQADREDRAQRGACHRNAH